MKKLVSNHAMDINSEELINLINKFKWRESPLLRLRNWKQLSLVLSAAVSNEKYVPLSPLGVNLIGSKEILNDEVPTKQEATIIISMIKFGVKYYGEPVFDYFEVDEERYEDVDFWRNLIKIGRETGPESAKKRVEAVKDLADNPVGGTIQPEIVHLQKAQVEFASMYSHNIVSRDKATFNITYSSETSTTNSGEPFYMRKNRVVDGVSIRDKIASYSKSLDYEEMAQLPAFLGARAQRGKWNLINSSDKWQTVEEFCKDLSLKSESEAVNLFLKHVRFSNYKARIISAAPSIDAYSKSRLVFELIEAEKTKTATNAIHLLGPVKLKEWMLSIKKFSDEYTRRTGLKMHFYNADATNYDRTIRKEHASWLSSALLTKLPKHVDKMMCNYMFMSNLTRELLYLERPVKTVNELKRGLKKLRIKETLRSGEVDTNYFGSSVIYLCIYAARRERFNEWDALNDEVRKLNLGLIQTDGDDNITAYFGNDIKDLKYDIEETAKLLESKYGLSMQDPTNKGELGLFYTQYRLTHDNRFLSPLSRLRLYWKETSRSALPAYTYVVTLFQNLEFRRECKGVVEFIRTFIIPYDDTSLGMVNRNNGKKISYDEFKALLKAEANSNNTTLEQMLFKGNPYDEHMLDSNGKLSNDWLFDQWSYWAKALASV